MPSYEFEFLVLQKEQNIFTYNYTYRIFVFYLKASKPYNSHLAGISNLPYHWQPFILYYQALNNPYSMQKDINR